MLVKSLVTHLFLYIQFSLWNFSLQQNSSFNISSVSQKKDGKKLSKVICRKEISKDFHVTVLTYYSVYLFHRRLRKHHFHQSSLHVSGLGNTEQKMLHASLLNALIPAHKGSNFAQKSSYMVYFSTDLRRAKWSLVYITLIFSCKWLWDTASIQCALTWLLIFVLTAFLFK